MRNSALITLGTVLGVCVISGLAAYALSRLDVPGSSAFVVYLFVGTTIPGQLFIIPLFFLWVRLGLVNTLTRGDHRLLGAFLARSRPCCSAPICCLCRASWKRRRGSMAPVNSRC